MSVHQFETPGPVRLQVRNEAGEVRIETQAAARTDVEVRALTGGSQQQADLTRVECHEESGGYRVIVEVPSPRHSFLLDSYGVEVRIRVPEGAFLEITSASADVAADGQYGGGSIRTSSGDVQWGRATGDVDIATASGDTTVQEALAALQVRSASGDILVGRACGELRLAAESGDITVRTAEGSARLRGSSSGVEVGTAAGSLDVQTSSGDVTVQEAYADCSLSTRSGDVDLLTALAGKVTIETMSGDVQVGIAPGSRVAVDTQTRSGDLHSDIALAEEADTRSDAGPLVILEVRTLSGDIQLKRGHTPRQLG